MHNGILLGIRKLKVMFLQEKRLSEASFDKNATYQGWDVGIRKTVRNAKTQVKIIKTET